MARVVRSSVALVSIPDPASPVLARMPASPIAGGNLVGPCFERPPGAPSIEVHSPYTGAAAGQRARQRRRTGGQSGGRGDARQQGWGQTPIKERTVPLFRFRELVLASLDELAHSAARECGKTVDEARAGVLKGIEVVEYALSLQNLDMGGVARGQPRRALRGAARAARRGGGITPFNFPAMVPMWMFPIAITLGNCFVLKPSEKVPLTALHAGRADARGRLSRRACSRWCTADAPRSMRCSSTRTSRPTASSARPRWRAHVYARGAALGKRVLALGGAKNTHDPRARRRPRAGGAAASWPRSPAARDSAAWRAACWSPSATATR